MREGDKDLMKATRCEESNEGRNKKRRRYEVRKR